MPLIPRSMYSPAIFQQWRSQYSRISRVCMVGSWPLFAVAHARIDCNSHDLPPFTLATSLPGVRLLDWNTGTRGMPVVPARNLRIMVASKTLGAVST